MLPTACYSHQNKRLDIEGHKDACKRQGRLPSGKRSSADASGGITQDSLKLWFKFVFFSVGANCFMRNALYLLQLYGGAPLTVAMSNGHDQREDCYK